MPGLRLPRLFATPGAPLSVQIVALLVGGLVVAQVVTLGLTLLLPPKPAAEYRLDDIARALKGGALHVANPRPLVRVMKRQPPSTQSAGWLVSERSREDLARLVGVDAQDVRLLFYSPLPFAGASGLALNMHPQPAVATAGFWLGQAGPSGGGGGGGGGQGGFPGGGGFGVPFSGGAGPGSRMGDREGGFGRRGAQGQGGQGRVGPSGGFGGGRGVRGAAGQDVPASERAVQPAAPVQWGAQGPVVGGLGPRGAALARSLISPGAPLIPSTRIADTAAQEARPAPPPPAAVVQEPVVEPVKPPTILAVTPAPAPALKLAPAAVDLAKATPAAPVHTAAAPPVPAPEHDGYVLPSEPQTGRGLFGLAPAPFVQGDFVAAVRTGADQWVTVQPEPEPFPNLWQRRVLLWFLIAFAVVTPLGLLFSRRLVAPLEAFALAAERLGKDPSGAVLPLKGPAEIGRAAKAFNQMQGRLKRYIDDRTAMVGAISHDLRTPLARMRFRLERAPAALRDPVLSDISQMEEMISSVLVFIRDASEPAVRERVDLRSILECVVDDAALMGADAQLMPGDPLPVEVDSLSVQRVLTNLVDNALKYGDHAHARLYREGEEVVAEIIDGGPGLPDEELERVFLPFYRSESARTLEKGGIGLGLAVSRSVARAHGGDVRLKSDGSGLHAQLRLPLAIEVARAA